MKCCYRDMYELRVCDDNTKTITFGKCCVLEHENFGRMPFSAVYECDDFWGMLNFKYQIMPNGHAYKPADHTFCCGTETCDWRNIPIKQIRVNINSCNLSCIMCHNNHRIDKDCQDMYWHLLNLVKGHQLDTIVLTTGGEPFLEKKKTIDYICSLTQNDCKEVKAITNGTTLDKDSIDKMAAACKEHGVKLHIQVSLDTRDKDAYCKIRNANEKQYEAVMYNIEHLHNAGVLYGINIVMMPENAHTVLEDIAYWHSRGIWMHVLPVRYDNGCGASQIKELIEMVKRDYSQYYGDA